MNNIFRFHLLILIVATILVMSCTPLPDQDATDDVLTVNNNQITYTEAAINENLMTVAWGLIELQGQTAILGANQQPLTMIFNDDRVSGFAGCNRFSSSVQLDNDQLQFGQVISTKMACVNSMEQELLFFSTLADVERFEINNNHLLLYDGSGVLLMSFDVAQ